MEALASFVPLVTFAFLVAFIYSSVGHGGASGYLALLSFYALPHEPMAASALCLNLLVAGMSFTAFMRAGHFSSKLTFPFISTSIPFAFLGGLFKIPKEFYALLLAAALIWAALRLFLDAYLETKRKPVIQPLPQGWPFLIGGLVGLLSGIVGVGGGIFLSPIILFFNWANAKQTAAASAFFIFVNSFAGLLGRMVRGSFSLQFSPLIVGLVAAAFLGGVLGSRLGAVHFSNGWLKRILAVVLLTASIKLLL